MNITEGEVFRNTTDGVDFIVKKIVNDMVFLQSQDGKRQILTEVRTLTSTPFYQKKGEEESRNKTYDCLFHHDGPNLAAIPIAYKSEEGDKGLRIFASMKGGETEREEQVRQLAEFILIPIHNC